MSHVSISNAILCVLLSCSLGLRDDDQHVLELGVNNFHKDQASRVKPKMEQLASSAPSTEVQGDIETALLLAKAQLEDELKTQHKKKEHEQNEIQKYQQEERNAQAIVDEWKCKYIGFIMDWVYQNYCSHLRDHQVPYLQTQVRVAQEELRDINAVISRLQGEVHQKLAASEAARLEEDLIATLEHEEESLKKQREASLSANAEMEKAETQKDDTKIAAFDKELGELAEVLKSTEEEHARLTEEHTGGDCEEKEAKGETTCERCAEGQKACGDTCISAETHCWYDAGCSCMEEPGRVSKEAGSRPEDDQTSNGLAAGNRPAAGQTSNGAAGQSSNGRAASRRPGADQTSNGEPSKLSVQGKQIKQAARGQGLWGPKGKQAKQAEQAQQGGRAAGSSPAADLSSNEPAASFLQVASATGQSHAHPLREKLNEAKAQLRKIIHAQDGKIENLAAQLATSNNDIAMAENAKAAAEQKFDAEIAQQKETQGRLTSAQQKAEDEKAAHEATLETTTQEGEQEIEKLVGELEADIQKLKQDLVETEHEKTDTMEANAASMNVLKDKNAAQINDIDIEIQKILREKDDAQKKLCMLIDAHAMQNKLCPLPGSAGLHGLDA